MVLRPALYGVTFWISALVLLGTIPAAQATEAVRAATQVAASQPAAYSNKPFPLDGKVQQVLEKAQQAYKNLRAYQDLGSVTTTMTVQGRTQEASSSAATTFERTSRFVASHEATNLYSDGQTLWVYMPAHGRYFQGPLSHAMGPDGASAFKVLLRNLPVLAMLLEPSSSLLATREAFESRYYGLEKIGQRNAFRISMSVPATAWFGQGANLPDMPGKVLVDAYFDANTYMLVRLNLNMTEAMRTYYSQTQGQGTAGQLQQVAWQFNAGNIRLNVPIPDQTFVFNVPARAVVVDTYAALTNNTSPPPPVNDEEEAELAEAEEANLPYAAPDFTLPDLAGQPVQLAKLRGKVVLVDFWATWCPPCRAALPGLQKLHDDLADKGLTVLAVDIGEEAQKVLSFAEKNRMTFKILLDEKNKVSDVYKVSAIPTTFMINRQGQVVKVFTGLTPEATLRQEVESLLEEAPASQPAATQAADSQASE